MSFAKSVGISGPKLHKESNEWPLPGQFIGLEFEIENPRGTCTSTHWSQKHDGSLRDHGIEYVFNGPKCGTELSEAIRDFFSGGVERYAVSPRTGFHIHLDMTQDTDSLPVMVAMMCVYYILEDVVYKIAGDNRRYLGFCYPLSSSTGYIEQIIRSYTQQDYNETERSQMVHQNMADTNRYFGFNMRSFIQHGTFEFRHFFMPSRDEGSAKVRDLVNTVMKMKRTALEINSPEGVCACASESPEKFISQVFDNAGPFLENKMLVEEVVDRANYLLTLLTKDKESSGVVESTRRDANYKKNPLLIKVVGKKRKRPVKKKEVVSDEPQRDGLTLSREIVNTYSELSGTYRSRYQAWIDDTVDLAGVEPNLEQKLTRLRSLRREQDVLRGEVPTGRPVRVAARTGQTFRFSRPAIDWAAIVNRAPQGVTEDFTNPPVTPNDGEDVVTTSTDEDFDEVEF